MKKTPIPAERKVRVRGAIAKAMRDQAISEAREFHRSLDGVIGIAISNFFAMKKAERQLLYRQIPHKFGRPLK